MNNTAEYGKDIGSYASHLEIKSPSGEWVRTLTLDAVPSGQPLNFNPEVALFDAEGQPVDNQNEMYA